MPDGPVSVSSSLGMSFDWTCTVTGSLESWTPVVAKVASVVQA